MLTWFTCSDHILEIMHDLTHESEAANTVVICCFVQSNAAAHFVGGKCRNHEPENVCYCYYCHCEPESCVQYY